AVEVEIAFKHFPKMPDWDQDLQSVCKVRKQSLGRATDHLKELLDRANPESYVSSKPEQVGQVQFVLAQLLAYQGNMDPAIEHWIRRYELAQKEAPDMFPEMLEVLGTAYFHKAEMKNQVYRNPGDRCLFPPRKTFRFPNTADSEQAISYFTKFLARKPDNQEVRWLLNLAY